MSVILKIDPSKKDVIISNLNHGGITINNNNVAKRKLRSNAAYVLNCIKKCERERVIT
jgi:hypothetical protein